VLAALRDLDISCELIVVNDCSSDGTPAILQRLAREHADVIRLFEHEVNQGKGAAVRTAIQQASGDICIVQDADLEYDPSDYQRLIQPILDGDADAVYGSRFLPSDRRRVLYFWHRLGNNFLTLLSNMFTDLDLTDMETCYKAVKTPILKSIPIRSNDFGIEPELTAKLAKRGCRIYEVPISYRGRSYEEGKKIGWRDGVRALWTIFYFRLVDDVYEEGYGHAMLYSLSRTHRLNSWMADLVRPWVGDRVLELGAGLGNVTLKLMPRHLYVAADRDATRLDYLHTRFGAYQWMEVRAIDPEDPATFAGLEESLDTVICLNSLENAASDERVLQHIYQTLVPGGIALILVPRGRWLYGPLDRALGQRRRYGRKELVNKCIQAGFTLKLCVSFNRIGMVPWLLNSTVFRRQKIGKLQLKLFDSFIWLWRRIDRLLPLPSLSLFVAVEKPLSSGGTSVAGNDPI
jgi:SAM-dependent methyltransferase